MYLYPFVLTKIEKKIVYSEHFTKKIQEKIEQKGLIHISEIQSGYVKSIHDIAKIGQKVMAQIIDIDEYKEFEKQEDHIHKNLYLHNLSENSLDS